MMKEKLEQISKETIAKIAEINSMQELQDLRVKVLGKKGELTEILRGMKDLSPEERPVVGALVNTVRDEIEAELLKAEEVLAKKEFDLLRYLMENQGIVLTRDNILETIWGYDFDGETRTVDVHVRTLRQKLGEGGSLIETVRGVGYRIGGGMG